MKHKSIPGPLFWWYQHWHIGDHNVHWLQKQQIFKITQISKIKNNLKHGKGALR